MEAQDPKDPQKPQDLNGHKHHMLTRARNKLKQEEEEDAERQKNEEIAVGGLLELQIPSVFHHVQETHYVVGEDAPVLTVHSARGDAHQDPRQHHMTTRGRKTAEAEPAQNVVEEHVLADHHQPDLPLTLPQVQEPHVVEEDHPIHQPDLPLRQCHKVYIRKRDKNQEEKGGSEEKSQNVVQEDHPIHQPDLPLRQCHKVYIRKRDKNQEEKGGSEEKSIHYDTSGKRAAQERDDHAKNKKERGLYIGNLSGDQEEQDLESGDKAGTLRPDIVYERRNRGPPNVLSQKEKDQKAEGITVIDEDDNLKLSVLRAMASYCSITEEVAEPTSANLQSHVHGILLQQFQISMDRVRNIMLSLKENYMAMKPGNQKQDEFSSLCRGLWGKSGIDSD